MQKKYEYNNINNNKYNEGNHNNDKDEEIIDYPARSTVLLGADGKPLPHTYDSTSTEEALHNDKQPINNNSSNNVNEEDDEDDKLEELRQDENTQRQHVKYFQQLIHSSSFAELCCTYANELLQEQCVDIAQNMKTVKTYDAASDSAKMLLVMTSLEKFRQNAFDAEFTIPRYVTLFAEELVRSTCSQ